MINYLLIQIESNTDSIKYIRRVLDALLIQNMDMYNMYIYIYVYTHAMTRHKRTEPQITSLESDMQVSVGCWIGHGPTYSVALAKGIPMKVGLSVSVYISIPVPRR